MGKINQNVLFSVSDRTGLLDLAKAFSDFGYGLIATGKTCQYLSENNLCLYPVLEKYKKQK